MNRLVRLLIVWLRARRDLRAGAEPRSPLDECRTPLRVMPNDLDLLRHMNNGSYLSLMDIGRIDMTVRSGAQEGLGRRGWFPVVVGESIRFRRPLNLGEPFEIVTRVLGWDERIIYVEQRFERPTPTSSGRPSRQGTGGPGGTGREVVAEAWVAARFLRRAGGTVPSSQVAEAFGLGASSPGVPADVVAWARSLDLAHRAAG